MTAVKTCGWADCQACAALRRFVDRHARGEITNRPTVTSAWWESQEAQELYRKGVSLPPCRHPEGGEQW
jgi:hypothetical protein